MSKLVIDLSEQPTANAPRTPVFGAHQQPKTKSKFGRIIGVTAAIFGAFLLVAAVGGYFYWQSYKNTPQYSLALLIDAARRGDQAEIDRLVDTDAVVDEFMPQVTNKAVELYGRGLPPQAIAKVAQVAAPVLPAVKERAKAELPRVIREKTDKFANVPFAAIVLGAGKYLDITLEGETAFIKSKIADRPLEVKMKRSGDKWQIVGVTDEQLATRIAQKIGQEIILVASKGGINQAGKSLGINNLQDLIKQAEDILK